MSTFAEPSEILVRVTRFIRLELSNIVSWPSALQSANTAMHLTRHLIFTLPSEGLSLGLYAGR